MNRPTIALLACLVTFQARADHWEFTISPYLWLPSLSLDSSDVDDGGDPGDDPSLEIGPIDYLDALDFTLMVSGDLRNQGWVVTADFLYVDFSIDDKDIDIGRPGTGPLAGRYSAALSGSIVSLSGGRTFSETERSRIDGQIGVRRFNMALDLSGELDSGNAFGLSSDIEYTDAFLAVDGRRALGDDGRWSLRYYADIGAGDADLTWQARLGFGYRYDWGEIFFDFRHLDYDFGSNEELENLTGSLSGPLFGATFGFGGNKTSK